MGIDRFVSRFSGTTSDNYIPCFVHRRGKFFYDKGLQNKSKHKKMHYTKDIKEAATHAIINAYDKEGHEPIILETIMNTDEAINSTTAQPVQLRQVWSIREDVEWKKLNPYCEFGLENLFNKHTPDDYMLIRMYWDYKKQGEKHNQEIMATT